MSVPVRPLLALLLAAPATGLAFAPVDSGLSPTLGEHVGPPSRVFRTHDDAQLRLSNESLAWQRFQSEFPSWTVRWDEATKTPLRMMGAGLNIGPVDSDEDAALTSALFLEELEGLMQIRSEELVPFVNVLRGDQRYVFFQRTVAGIPVEGAFVQLRFKFGKLVMIGLESHPMAGSVATTPRLSPERALNIARRAAGADAHVRDGGQLVILPIEGVEGLTYALTYRSKIDVPGTRPAQYTTYVDGNTGVLLHRYDDVRYGHRGQVSLGYEPRTVGDPVMSAPLRESFVGTSTFRRTLTDADGNYNYQGRNVSSLKTMLMGPIAVVQDDGGADLSASFDTDGAVGNDFDWGYGDVVPMSATNTYHHTQVVWDRAFKITPDLPELQSRMTVNVEINDSCNAFYNGRSINFFKDSDECNNTGRLADVVYHEYGHHYHHSLVVTGITDGSIGEGSGDYLSATITGEAYMAPGFFKNGAGIRDLEPDRVYPDDLTGEVHADGLIWGGAMWDVRKSLIAELGEEAGVELSDHLFATALMGGPSLGTSYEEVLIADDDDGDLSNGTPNLCLLSEDFGRHGLGPGVRASFSHTTQPEATAGAPLTLQVAISTSFDECLTIDKESAILRWSTNEEGPFNEIPLNEVEEGIFEGNVPAQAQGTIIYYAFSVDDEQGRNHSTDRGRGFARYQTYIGTLTQILCEGFESDDGGYTHALLDGEVSEGADDWMWGIPQGAVGDPTMAAEGSFVWGNDLAPEGFNGAYQGGKVNALFSPAYDTTGYDNVILRYRRWLNVEDGSMDQATIYVSGSQVWQNEASAEGTLNHEDRRWAWHYVPLNGLADNSSDVGITFELASNLSKEFGGWNIDDVCLFSID